MPNVLYKFQNVFVQIAKCICTSCKSVYLNCKMYSSKLQNICIHIAECIVAVSAPWDSTNIGPSVKSIL